ncbi:MAG: leucine-rich repeat domain-containing protein, partial [Coprobacillus sp.]
MKKGKKTYVKLLVSILTVMLTLTCFVTPAPIKAADVITGVGYTFNPDDGELTVNTDTGTFNWRDDTNIDKAKVMSINFGNLVTQIYSNAFSDCTSLESVVIPNTIEKMNDAAFAGCANLKKAEISDSVKTMGVYIFKDCTSLENVKLPANLESIAMRTFRGCSNLESIILPGNLKTINDEAF